MKDIMTILKYCKIVNETFVEIKEIKCAVYKLSFDCRKINK